MRQRISANLFAEKGQHLPCVLFGTLGVNKRGMEEKSSAIDNPCGHASRRWEQHQSRVVLRRFSLSALRALARYRNGVAGRSFS